MDHGASMSDLSPYRLPPLVWLRAFEAAARQGNFTAAAAELGLTPSAVSHQVRSLEQHLRHPLFERLARSLALTDFGRAYLSPVRKAFEDLSVSTLGLFGPPRDVTLTIRAPVSFGGLWLAPRLKRFAAAFPGIRVRLCSTVWAEALPAMDIDIDIRLGHGHWPGLRAELLLNDPCIVVSPPGSGVTTPGDLADATLIHIMGLEQEWLRLHRLAGVALPANPTGITVDTSIAALEMVAAGLGHALIMRGFAAPYLAAGRVRHAIARELPQTQAHYLVSGEDDKGLRPEATSFRDWLTTEARAAAGGTVNP